LKEKVPYKTCHLHPSQKKHLQLVQDTISAENLNFKLRVSPNDQCVVGDYSISLDFDFKGCSDTEDGKTPMKIVFFKILQVMSDQHLKCSLTDAFILPTLFSK